MAGAWHSSWLHKCRNSAFDVKGPMAHLTWQRTWHHSHQCNYDGYEHDTTEDMPPFASMQLWQVWTWHDRGNATICINAIMTGLNMTWQRKCHHLHQCNYDRYEHERGNPAIHISYDSYECDMRGLTATMPSSAFTRVMTECAPFGPSSSQILRGDARFFSRGRRLLVPPSKNTVFESTFLSRRIYFLKRVENIHTRVFIAIANTFHFACAFSVHIILTVFF